MDMKLFALVALLSMFVTAPTQSYPQSFGQVYCGRPLAMKLAELCNNFIKRAEPRSPDAATFWPWIPRHSARSMRNKRQVVSECCEKPCTIDELLSYCGN